MPEKKPSYPYIPEKESSSLRRRKKEELIAIICYLSKRLSLNETAVKEILMAHASASCAEEYFDMFTTSIKSLFDEMVETMEVYNGIIPDIASSQNVVTFELKSSGAFTHRELPKEKDKSEETTPKHDPSDITIQ